MQKAASIVDTEINVSINRQYSKTSILNALKIKKNVEKVKKNVQNRVLKIKTQKSFLHLWFGKHAFFQSVAWYKMESQDKSTL